MVEPLRMGEGRIPRTIENPYDWSEPHEIQKARIEIVSFSAEGVFQDAFLNPTLEFWGLVLSVQSLVLGFKTLDLDLRFSKYACGFITKCRLNTPSGQPKKVFKLHEKWINDHDMDFFLSKRSLFAKRPKDQHRTWWTILSI